MFCCPAALMHAEQSCYEGLIFEVFNSGPLKKFYLCNDLEYPVKSVWYRGVIRIYPPQYIKINSLRD